MTPIGAIAQALASSKFKANARTRTLTHSVGDLEFAISIRGNPKYNRTGRFAGFLVSLDVSSNGFGIWKRDNPNKLLQSLGVGGSLLWIEFFNLDPCSRSFAPDINLAPRRTRKRRTEKLIRKLQRYAIPWFQRADGSMNWLIASISDEVHWEPSILAFGLYAHGKEGGNALVEAYLRKHPNRRQHFEAALVEFRVSGRVGIGDPSSYIAAIVVSEGLEIPDR